MLRSPAAAAGRCRSSSVSRASSSTNSSSPSSSAAAAGGGQGAGRALAAGQRPLGCTQTLCIVSREPTAARRRARPWPPGGSRPAYSTASPPAASVQVAALLLGAAAAAPPPPRGFSAMAARAPVSQAGFCAERPPPGAGAAPVKPLSSSSLPRLASLVPGWRRGAAGTGVAWGERGTAGGSGHQPTWHRAPRPTLRPPSHLLHHQAAARLERRRQLAQQRHGVVPRCARHQHGDVVRASGERAWHQGAAAGRHRRRVGGAQALRLQQRVHLLHADHRGGGEQQGSWHGGWEAGSFGRFGGREGQRLAGQLVRPASDHGAVERRKTAGGEARATQIRPPRQHARHGSPGPSARGCASGRSSTQPGACVHEPSAPIVLLPQRICSGPLHGRPVAPPASLQAQQCCPNVFSSTLPGASRTSSTLLLLPLLSTPCPPAAARWRPAGDHARPRSPPQPATKGRRPAVWRRATAARLGRPPPSTQRLAARPLPPLAARQTIPARRVRRVPVRGALRT